MSVGPRYIVKVKAIGYRSVYGVSSSYDTTYPVGELEGIVSEQEFKRILNQLNDAILSFWPCNTVYFGGIACSFCTLGGSFVCGPQICLSEAEKAAVKLLEQYTLKATFFDNNISFELHKTFIDSWIEISCPISYAEKHHVPLALLSFGTRDRNPGDNDPLLSSEVEELDKGDEISRGARGVEYGKLGQTTARTPDHAPLPPIRMEPGRKKV